ncbi:MAG: hypothetical protein IPP91_02875 [Betaproteobacteria bacterium]|nr:hypothetical protein [Betaproteobacteria bacterium]
MSKNLVAFALLLALLPDTSWAQVVAKLVGRYQMEVQGGDILELRADGTAWLAGDEMKWSVKGNQLVVGTDVMAYSLQGDRLMLTFGAIQLAWKRIGGAGKVPSAMQSAANKAKPQQPSAAPAPAATAANGNAQDDQARQVLTNNAWCSFTYNKTSGTSTTRKVVFRPDGLMTVNGGAESYSSGYGGTYAGQSRTGSAMRWRLENLRVFVDQGNGGGFQDIGLTANRNSNGSLILSAGGREYSMCN